MGVAVAWAITLPEETTVTYMMLLALVPLVVAVGIALVFDRWNAHREGKRPSQQPNRRRGLRL
jgi:hypothetical protein